jgi:hypothetical protein
MADSLDASLLPVIVGGMLTIAGGLIGTGATLLTNWRQARIDMVKQRAAKFEELVCSVYDLDDWLDARQDILIYGSTEKSGPSPVARMEAIGAVYFPSFLSRIAALKATTIPYHLWMAEAAQRKKQGNLARVDDGLMDAYKPYLNARDALLDALMEHGSKAFRKAPRAYHLFKNLPGVFGATVAVRRL